LIQSFDETLYEIKKAEGGFGRSGYDYEIKRGIVTVCYERWGVVVRSAMRRGRSGEERRKSRARLVAIQTIKAGESFTAESYMKISVDSRPR
jgi:hypothetical protein